MSSARRPPSASPLAWAPIAALALAAAAGCSGGSGFPDAGPGDAPPPTGKFSVAWSIADGARAVTCDEVGGLVVSVEVTSPALNGGFVEAFTCGLGTNTSRDLPVGLYDLSFELVGRSGTLGTLLVQRVMVTADAVTPTADLLFPVKAEGLLDTRLVAGPTANCATPGANMATMSIVLERQGGACVPTTFTIGAGAGRAGFQYASTCATPTPTAVCIERDQTITATVGSGSYVVRARGFVGLGPVPPPAQCWTTDQLIDVPPEQRTLRLDIGMTYLKGIAGCP
jgi:hypothetical protein